MRFAYITKFLIIICLSLALTGCKGRTVIVNSVKEREANEIYLLLSTKGIEVQKTPVAVGGAAAAGAAQEQLWDISVPARDITAALSILNQAGLPRAKGTSLLDLFGEKGIVPSAIEDRIRYQEGLSEQLAMTIRKMDGIIDADVQITLPSEETTEETKEPLTASVYVKHQGVLDNPNSILITKIKRLVASAVPGLTIDNVTVVADRAIYSDIILPPGKDGLDIEKSYVSIWGIVLAKESVVAFRFLFYIFILLIFLCFCFLAWLAWKFYPIVKAKGLKSLFDLEPIDPKSFTVIKEETTIEPKP